MSELDIRIHSLGAKDLVYDVEIRRRLTVRVQEKKNKIIFPIPRLSSHTFV